MGEQNTLRLCGATNSNFPNFSIYLLLYNDTYINLPWKPRVLLELPANPGNLKNSAHDSSASNGLALRQMERYGGGRAINVNPETSIQQGKTHNTHQSMVSVSGFRMCWGNSLKVGRFFVENSGFKLIQLILDLFFLRVK